MTTINVSRQRLREVKRWINRRQAKMTPEQRRYEHRQAHHFRHLIEVNRALEQVATGPFLAGLLRSPWCPSQLMFVIWDQHHRVGRHPDFTTVLTKPAFVPLYPINCDNHWLIVNRLAALSYHYDSDGYFIRLLQGLPEMRQHGGS